MSDIDYKGKITLLQNTIALQRKQIDALRLTAIQQDAQIAIKDALLEAYREDKAKWDTKS